MINSRNNIFPEGTEEISQSDAEKIAKIEEEMRQLREQRKNYEERYSQSFGIDESLWKTVVNEVHQWFLGEEEIIDKIINTVKSLIILKENKGELFYIVTTGSRFTQLSSMEMVMGIKLLELYSKSFSKKVLDIYKKYSKNL